MKPEREITVKVSESLLEDFRIDVGAKRLGVERQVTTLETDGVSVSVDGDEHTPSNRVPVTDEEVLSFVLWHTMKNNLDRLTVR
jgi:hypothetical protein